MSPKNQVKPVVVSGPKAIDRRTSLIATSRKLIRTEGLTALNLRTVAERDGTSTQAIYTLFGGKVGLIQALYEHWIQELEQRITLLLPTMTTDELMCKTAHIYREQALAEPELFLAGTTPTAIEADVLGLLYRSSAFTVCAQILKTGIDTGQYLSTLHPEATTRTLWATVHGVVMFEICSHIDQQHGPEMLNNMLTILLRGLHADH